MRGQLAMLSLLLPLASCGETVLRELPTAFTAEENASAAKAVAEGDAEEELTPPPPQSTPAPGEPPSAMGVHCDFVGLIGELAECSAVAEFAKSPAREVSAEVTWTSENEDIVVLQEFSLTRGALFHLRKPGQAKIRAALNGVSADRLVEVKDYGFEALRLSPDTAKLPLGLPLRLKATALYKDRDENFYALDVSRNVAWTSSDESIATFDDEDGREGVLRSKKPGKLTAESFFAVEEGHSRKAAVEVSSAYLEGLVVEDKSAAAAKLYVGTLTGFRLTAKYSDGSTYDATEWAKWEVLDEGVAAFEGPGVLRALKTAAKVNLRAFFGGHVAQYSVAIVESDIESIELSPQLTSLYIGQETTFSVQARWRTGESQDVTDAVQWESSNESILWVQRSGNDKGVVLPIKKGKATLTVRFGQVSDSLEITVQPETIRELVFLPEALEMEIGDEAAAQVLGVIDEDVQVILPQGFEWEATPPGIVDLRPSGNAMVVLALKEGVAELFLRDEKRARRTLRVTVKPKQPMATPSPTPEVTPPNAP